MKMADDASSSALPLSSTEFKFPEVQVRRNLSNFAGGRPVIMAIAFLYLFLFIRLTPLLSQNNNKKRKNHRRVQSRDIDEAIIFVVADLVEIIARFCSTLSWQRNRTNVASEVRPRFSTLYWYVNHVTSGLATVSRRSRFFFSPWSFCG